jgi:hypothetical protein
MTRGAILSEQLRSNRSGIRFSRHWIGSHTISLRHLRKPIPIHPCECKARAEQQNDGNPEAHYKSSPLISDHWHLTTLYRRSRDAI